MYTNHPEPAPGERTAPARSGGRPTADISPTGSPLAPSRAGALVVGIVAFAFLVADSSAAGQAPPPPYPVAAPSAAGQAPSPPYPVAVPAAGQAPPPPDPAAEELLGMGWLVGTWEGEGWMQMGPDRTVHFRQLEVVRQAMGGRALVIEGTALAMADGRVIEGLPPVHEALAVLTRDADSGEPTFRAWRGEGEGVLRVDADVEIRDGVLVWGFHDPAFGHFRYRISLNPAGEWYETGRFSPDGEQWFDFFEMTLRRTPG